MPTNVKALAPLFGSLAEVARVAGVDKAAVTRWGQNLHPVAPVYQRRIVAEARKRGLDVTRVYKALGTPKCPACGTYHW
jgi:hypothetical protein